MSKYLLRLICIVSLIGCGRTASTQSNNQPTPSRETVVGGDCDGCYIMFEGMPPENMISSSAKIAGDQEPGERMEITGKVFMKDGKTPAKDIILYLYHTDASGKYSAMDTQTLGKRNGHLRSWVKTGENGSFQISSIRPASYPNSNIPAHIHIFIKEPGKTPYYIDEVWFDDDPLVTPEVKRHAEKRGGNMLMHLSKNSRNAWTGNLNITLGLNIPGY